MKTQKVSTDTLSLDNLENYVKYALKVLTLSKILTKESCQVFFFNVNKETLNICVLNNYNEKFLLSQILLTEEQRKIFTKKRFFVKVTEDMKNEI